MTGTVTISRDQQRQFLIFQRRLMESEHSVNLIYAGEQLGRPPSETEAYLHWVAEAAGRLRIWFNQLNQDQRRKMLLCRCRDELHNLVRAGEIPDLVDWFQEG